MATSQEEGICAARTLEAFKGAWLGSDAREASATRDQPSAPPTQNLVQAKDVAGPGHNVVDGKTVVRRRVGVAARCLPLLKRVVGL